ncbi:uncharacterized protein BCR38DRAFT_407255 [Pseudomassariella vexata]|uniref:Uncharacterized protein n=1 Tax=Pseudomassariella vexata TaxID=1141098 RepID=A0A1Y2E6U8_9PEZI|nr:uncharacterized protein BCR38DRAFT_407255 [Pseudomassariella vexata]ORY67262.1 hypothetical protein BCR38DRAFT_407255 [Pseudomassariella vexata]
MPHNTLFHKKSKSSMRQRQTHADEHTFSHSRTTSNSSNSSNTSHISSGSYTKPNCYDPLSLHPPMALNTSPCIIPEDDEAVYGDEKEQQDPFKQSRTSNHDTQNPAPSSPIKSRRNTHVYGLKLQWPLQDWQEIPPGLAEMSEADVNAQASPRSPTSQRRPPKEHISDIEMFVKRGEWKRKGIVFHLDADAQEEQVQSFELELP